MRSDRISMTAALFVLFAALTPPPSFAEPPAFKVERALMAFLESPNADAEAFGSAWIAPSARNEAGAGACIITLGKIYTDLHGCEAMDVMIAPDGSLVMEFVAPGHKQFWLHCQIQDAEPYLISNIWIEGGPALLETPETLREIAEEQPLTWESIGERIDAEEQDGFAGALLLVRNGEVVLHQGYGMANQEKGIANNADTVFAIGSAPIDFTFVGILMLEEQGKLALSDPITKYFDDVPADKRSMTIEHLMTARSGLQDFHGCVTDRDHDHSWISRDEAMRRIFGQELLFAPGEGREHSHSAWGVLAAILEIVSGQSYQDFTHTNLFKPLGMTDTGFHGDAIPEARTAIGYGFESDGIINAPSYWESTSWLVMGSGGQVSTTGDMGKWIEAVLDGRLLNEANTQRFRKESRGLLNGGNSYGYEIYYTYTPNTYMVMLANAVDGSTRRAVGDLARALGDLIQSESAAPFSLGVQLGFDGGRLSLAEVVQGSAAERDGLLQDDVIIGINGKPLGEDPLSAMVPYLQSGEAMPIDVERDGKRLRIVVTPKRR